MATKPLSDLTATWNAGGTTFTAIKMNATDTASAAGSALMDLQVGGVSQFKVSKAGAVTAVGVAIPTISSTDTLTNKTLSSPTLSGTVSGTPTFGGMVQVTVNSGNYELFQLNNSSAAALMRYVGAGGGSVDIGAHQSTASAGIIRAGGSQIAYFSGDGWAFGSAFGGTQGAGTLNANGYFDDGVAVPTISSTDTLSNKTLSGVTIADATNIILNTTTGTKIGTATSQKLGFFDTTPVVQPTAVADATTAVDVITRFNELLTRMRNLGLIAT
jgi:hypothetical protein